MTPGKGILVVLRRAFGFAMAASCALAFGCRSNPQRATIEKNLYAEKAAKGHHREIVERYLIGCPDSLEVHVVDRPEFNGAAMVGPDGRLSLGHYGKIRVEGLTLSQAAQAIAERVGARPEHVNVRVVEFASRPLVLTGEVIGQQRAVPYQGEETVLDVLRRVGGITPGAEPTEVYVVRSHIAEDGRPEVFHVDLEAIVLNKDHETNIRVRPYDQIYVGETRQARVEKCIPPWVRPAYQKVWNMIPSGKTAEEMHHSVTGWIRGILPFGSEPTAEGAATATAEAPETKKDR